MKEENTVLQVDNLSVSFAAAQGEVQAVRSASFSVKRGEVLAIVGASGSGKSVLCKSVMKLLPASARIRQGTVTADGADITDYTEKQMQSLRGSFFAMVFQDPLSTLNPTMTIGAQIAEAVLVHKPRMPKEELQGKVLELMELVGIDQAMARTRQYPHHFSGGMRQRIVLAIALAGSPKLIFADEPTTALDVATQSQILDLFRKVQQCRQTAMVFVSHDLGVVKRVADRVAIMHEGQIVEAGTVEEIFLHPKQAHTMELLSALARRGRRNASPVLPMCGNSLNAQGTPRGEGCAPKDAGSEILLDVRHLSHSFMLTKKQAARVLDDVSFSIRKGEIFGLVGESGSGKSTIARCIMNIYRALAGEIIYDGVNVCDRKQFRANRSYLRTSRQMIFQDSGASLNPRMKVADIIAEPFRIHHLKPVHTSLRDEVLFQLVHVGMGEGDLDKYPSELSGGQRQRVAIARSLVMEPKLLVADEPVASLDVSTQAQIVDLFRHLQQEHGFTFLFIAHDLNLVESLCDSVGVMHRGRLVETAPARELFAHPKHEYTKRLLL